MKNPCHHCMVHMICAESCELKEEFKLFSKMRTQVITHSAFVVYSLLCSIFLAMGNVMGWPWLICGIINWLFSFKLDQESILMDLVLFCFGPVMTCTFLTLQLVKVRYK